MLIRRITPFACLAAFLFVGMATNVAKAGGNETRLEGQLSGTNAAPLASGKAKFESRNNRTRISIQAEDLLFATSIRVTVNGTTIGTATVFLGFADLNLDSRNGDAAPAIHSGDEVKVFDELGTMILSGTMSQK